MIGSADDIAGFFTAVGFMFAIVFVVLIVK